MKYLVIHNTNQDQEELLKGLGRTTGVKPLLVIKQYIIYRCHDAAEAFSLESKVRQCHDLQEVQAGDESDYKALVAFMSRPDPTVETVVEPEAEPLAVANVRVTGFFNPSNPHIHHFADIAVKQGERIINRPVKEVDRSLGVSPHRTVVVLDFNVTEGEVADLRDAIVDADGSLSVEALGDDAPVADALVVDEIPEEVPVADPQTTSEA